ncbi:hypothetical protein [Pseudarthrobacter sp. MEB009]|uniref:hypothetical protein n=1 Tax=Pseudarthrobacter sp. MEB009 TaxID=3040326 RepID=UPI0025555969|nr:hypothetical protein [Pseudarthrobacter sp. MEB009]
MSDARDELQSLIEDAVESAIYNSADAPPSLTGIVASHATDAVLAAGYSKPRTISTVEELDALPEGSIILDGEPDALLKTSMGNWRSLMDPESSYGSKYIILPATVIHEPTP